MEPRIIAQRVLTGEFLHWDLPLKLDSPPRRELSGPGQMRGMIDPVWTSVLGSDGLPFVDEWSTALYYERDGKITWGGIVTHVDFAGQRFQVEAAGFTAYAAGQPFLGVLRAGYSTPQDDPYAGKDQDYDGYVDGTDPPEPMPPPPPNVISPSVDAFEVVRRIWGHLQDQPDGALGLVVDGHDSGYLLGSTNGIGEPDGTSPYQLVWWETPDCGNEIDTIMKQAKGDYVETHQWKDGSRDSGIIEHRLRLGRPRRGTRRTDLRFVEGENIVDQVPPSKMGEEFANEIYGVGKGEGTETLVTRMPQRDLRLRRCRVWTDKSVGNTDRLTALVRNELAARAQALHVPAIRVRDHPNAPLGAWELGDDILVQASNPWTGRFATWHRVVAEEIAPDDTATLSLIRCDFFT